MVFVSPLGTGQYPGGVGGGGCEGRGPCPPCPTGPDLRWSPPPWILEDLVGGGWRPPSTSPQGFLPRGAHVCTRVCRGAPAPSRQGRAGRGGAQGLQVGLPLMPSPGKAALGEPRENPRDCSAPKLQVFHVVPTCQVHHPEFQRATRKAILRLSFPSKLVPTSGPLPGG